MDAVYLDPTGLTSTIYLASDRMLPHGVSSTLLFDPMRQQTTSQWTALAYPKEPRHAFHKHILLQHAYGAAMVEEDGHDFYALGRGSAPRIWSRAITQPEIADTLRRWTLGAYLLNATCGRAFASFAWDERHTLEETRAYGRRLIAAGDYLLQLDAATLDELYQYNE